MFSGILTIKHALARACRWHPARDALIDGERVVTFAGFGDACRRIANGYLRLGARKGDRITFLCKASADHALAYYAGQEIGAICVNLHLRETVPQQVRLLQRLEPTILVYDAEKEATVREIVANFPEIRTVRLGGTTDTVGVALSDLLIEPDDESGVEVVETDPAVIQLTSGSTGVPKALVHSHASVLESWSGGLYMWSGIEPQDRFLSAFSPSFVVWIVHPGSFLIHGAAVVFQNHWDPQSFLELVEREKVTCTALTPTQWRAVLAASPERHALDSLRMAAYLGEKIAPEHLKELMARVCPLFCSFYGMSECLGLGGCVIRSPEWIDLDKWGSVGKPGLNTDLRITEPGGRACEPKEPGQLGEVVVRAASFAQSSMGDPEWRRRVLTSDGWYRTGDLGYVDRDGYVFLVGRVDNQINTGGVKVAPEEVEQAIHAHPDVAELAVLGVPDEHWGERIIALVVPRRSNLTVDDLDRWCRDEDRLAGFKRPKEWRFVQALPHNSAGKLDRKALRRLLEGQQG